MQKRLILPSLLFMYATGAQALTLGQIHVHSYINQPLKATIDIKGVEGDELDAFRVKLASRTTFKNAGVDWSEKLEGLRFSLIQRHTGPAIRVTSRQAVTEPFLSFVVDANWENGQLVKDFTLLLDPPLYSGKQAAPVKAPAAASVTGKQQQAVKPPQPEAVTAPRDGAGKVTPRRSEGTGSAQAMTGSSLWQVASRVRPDGATMQQTMIAIHEENPEAFMRGNINLLKKGELLRIPSEEVILGVSENAAVQRVARHQRALRAGRSISSSKRLSPEIVALAEAPVKPADQQPAALPQEADQGGRLTLDSATEAGSDVSQTGEPGTGEPGLAADATVNEENKMLRSRVELLEEQLGVAHKLIRMRGELAQLQQLYRQIDEQKALAGTDQQPGAEGADSSLATADEVSDQELLGLTAGGMQEDAGRIAAETGESGTPAAPHAQEQERQPASSTFEGDQQLATIADAEPRSEADTKVQTDEADAQTTTAASSTEVETEEAGEDAAVADDEPVAAMDAEAGDESTLVDGTTDEKPADEDVTASLDDTAGEPQMSPDDAVDAGSETLPAASLITAVEEPQTPAGPDDNVMSEDDSGSAATSARSQEPAAAGIPPSASDSLIKGIDNNLLIGAGGALALLFTFLIGRASRRAGRDSGYQDDELVGEFVGERSDDQGSGEHEAAPDAQPATVDVDRELSQQQDETLPSGSELSDTLGATTEVDPAEQAALLLRNGDAATARAVLLQAVEAEPERPDLHMQLLEVLHGEGDRQAFETEMNNIESSGAMLDNQQWLKIERMHGNLLPSGIESLGVVNRRHAEAEVINLDGDSMAGAGDVAVDAGEDESDDSSEAELEAALQAFEKELQQKQSSETLAEAELALDETAEILDNAVTKVIPDARVVEDLELEDELVLEETPESDPGVEGITLDDSFGIDSHIKSDFDDILADAADQAQDERQDDDALPGSEPDAETTVESEDLSVTSFDKEPEDVKHAEVEAKIDLAAAFADMGDIEGARDILDEVLADGSAQQRQAAEQLLKKYL
ncbi:MAG: FimV/HubP family polar landmark protein [Pseudomonadota bacterium]